MADDSIRVRAGEQIPGSRLEADLRERWLPSAEQMKLADALLEAGYTAERGEHRERGVYTTHLLLNKEYGLWTAGVELVFLDGVFLTREAAFEYLHLEAKKHYDRTGTKLVGGYAWHMDVAVAAVWDDITSEFPTPSWKKDQ